MNQTPALLFEYAIKFPDGTYYQGPRYDAKQKRLVHDNPSLRGPKHQAYTYTEHRAFVIITQNKETFEGCAIERVV